MVSTPVTTQATSSHPGLPTWRAMSAETMKMPEPIIEPTTTIVASNRPSPRLNSVSSAVRTPVGAARGSSPSGPLRNRMRGATHYTCRARGRKAWHALSDF